MASLRRNMVWKILRIKRINLSAIMCDRNGTYMRRGSEVTGPLKIPWLAKYKSRGEESIICL